MADNIKVINAGDLLKGVKLSFAQGPADVAATSVAVQKEYGAGPGGGRPALRASTSSVPAASPLNDVASSLAEQFAASDWLVPPGQPNDWRFMVAVARAALVAWYTPAETLRERLGVVEALARAFGLGEDEVEQVVAEALQANAHVASQLALQLVALAAGSFAVGPDSWPSEAEGKAGFPVYRREAIPELVQLLQQQQKLPAFNGLLQAKVMAAVNLRIPKGKARQLHPYAELWVSPPGASRKSDRRATKVLTDTDHPAWEEPLEPLIVGGPDWELTVHVKSALDPDRGPSSKDPLLGRAAVRLAGLAPGLSATIKVVVFGPREAAEPSAGAAQGAGGSGGGGGARSSGAKKGKGGGGLCGCFGGGGGVKGEEEEAGQEPEEPQRRTPQARPLPVPVPAAGPEGGEEGEEGGPRTVYDPASAMTSGAAGRQERGQLTLILRYLPEKREPVPAALQAAVVAVTAAEAGGAGVGGDRPSRKAIAIHSPRGEPHDTPTAAAARSVAVREASAALDPALQAVVRQLGSRLSALHAPQPASMKLLRRLDSRKLDPKELLSPANDFGTTLRKLAKALQTLARDGSGKLARVPDPGLPLTALGPLGEWMDDQGLEQPVGRLLPYAGLPPPCLSLLLLFARLYRVRRATTQIALAHSLIAGGWPAGDRAGRGGGGGEAGGTREPPAWPADRAGKEYLEVVYRLWKPTMEWHCSGRLTKVEAEGLTGCMASFLEGAMPLLADHYRAIPEGEQAVPCLVRLLEMTGWALTWDPSKPPPLRLLAEHLLTRAAVTRAAAEAEALGRPGPDTLPHDVMALARAAERQLEDLTRDLELQAAAPGLEGLARLNTPIRYHALVDSLETLFMYRPGSSNAAATALWKLEADVVALHTAMIRHGLGRDPRAPVSKRRLNANGDRPGATANGRTANGQTANRPAANRRQASDSDSDVSPISSAVSTPNARTPQARTAKSHARPGLVVPQSRETEDEDGSGEGEDEDEEGKGGLLEDGGEGTAPVVLFDLEGHMTEALAQWAELEGDDLKRKVLRLLERDPIWPPRKGGDATAGKGGAEPAGRGADKGAGAAGGGGAAAKGGKARKALAGGGAGDSAVELFRLMQAYLDVSLERALGGSPERPPAMGPAVCEAVVSALRIYLHFAMRAWDQIIACRMIPADGPAGHRHAKTFSDRLFGGPGAGGTPGGGPAPSGPSGIFPIASGASVAGASPHGPNGPPAFAHGRNISISRHTPGVGGGVFAASGAVAAAALAGGSPAATYSVPEYGAMLPSSISTAAGSVAAYGLGAMGGAGPSGFVGAVGGGAGHGPSPLKLPPPAGGRHRRANTADAEALAAGAFATAGAAAAAAAAAGGGGPGAGGGARHAPTSSLNAPAAAGAPPFASPMPFASGAIPQDVLLDLAAEQGFVSCSPLVRVRNTLAAVADGVEAMRTDTLSVLIPRASFLGGRADGPGTGPPPSQPAYLARAVAELRQAMSTAAGHCVASYGLALRTALLQRLIGAMDPEGKATPSKQPIEGILGALYTELSALAGDLVSGPVAGAMVGAAWGAAVGCVTALALGQAGFRPLTEEEAFLLRDFLIELQDLFRDVVDEQLEPKQKAHAASGGPPLAVIPVDLVDANSRAQGCALTSALLQSTAAASQDLIDMYNAQVSCLQRVESRREDGAPLATHQLSLLDLLRLLRHRRKTDTVAQSFVTEQLRLAGSNVLQGLFGLGPKERLVASSPCSVTYLPGLAALAAGAAGGPATPAAAAATAAANALAAAAAAGTVSTAFGQSLGGGLGIGLVGASPGASSREGFLYVTPRMLGFSTLLGADLKGMTDTTFKLRLNDVRETVRGETADCLVVATAGGDVYLFTGLGPGERDRLLGLLTGTPVPGTGTHPQLAAVATAGAGGRGSSGGVMSDSPQASVAGGGGGSDSTTPRGGMAAVVRGMMGKGSSLGHSSNASGTVAAAAAALSSAVGGPGPAQLSAAAAPAAASAQAATGSAATTAATKAQNVAAKAADAIAAAAAAGGGAVTGAARAAAEAAATAHATAAAEIKAAANEASAATARAFGSLFSSPSGAANPFTSAAPAGTAAPAAPPRASPAPGTASRPPESGALPLVSTPCHLVSVLRNKDGHLHLYADRLDFICPADPAVSRSLTLSSINNVSQRPGGWGGGSVLVIALEGEPKPLLFGGMGDALLAQLKQSVSELCFARG
ncbi:hypothetical protein HYH03_003633 [Edaphochlamys debaryana]|uniref:C2 domain-containing protein n=1 Tax=Edaphochlamys debaryana TaxID=47281 RepID=A0A835YAY9_9CHLO|nr:hypothetical protein HYH03_003633 [Edaphochlamys debaryana]|eukprot:KAG2498374.1 hypothetical protein HYH03_003633 [Edaphochlamys debaryana]